MLFVGIEGVGCAQLSGDTGRQLEACHEAHQRGLCQQRVLRIQQMEQFSASRGVHVPPQLLLGTFNLGVQFAVFLTVEALLQGLHVVIHCGTSFW